MEAHASSFNQPCGVTVDQVLPGLRTLDWISINGQKRRSRVVVCFQCSPCGKPDQVNFANHGPKTNSGAFEVLRGSKLRGDPPKPETDVSCLFDFFLLDQIL